MQATLETFVNGALDALGATRIELGSGAGVYRGIFEESETAAQVARFLGRDESDLLFTFDLARWEEGTKLECLNSLSPLVQRLGAYACGLGRVAHAYIPGDGKYALVLAARFGAKFVCDTVRRKSRWLGTRIDIDEPIKIKGSALDNAALTEGNPPGADDVDLSKCLEALQRMADTWNRDVAKEGLRIQADLERRYNLEAGDIVHTRSGEEAERALRLLIERMRLNVDSRLDIAVVIWIPAAAKS